MDLSSVQAACLLQTARRPAQKLQREETSFSEQAQSSNAARHSANWQIRSESPPFPARGRKPSVGCDVPTLQSPGWSRMEADYGRYFLSNYRTRAKKENLERVKTCREDKRRSEAFVLSVAILNWFYRLFVACCHHGSCISAAVSLFSHLILCGRWFAEACSRILQ